MDLEMDRRKLVRRRITQVISLASVLVPFVLAQLVTSASKQVEIGNEERSSLQIEDDTEPLSLERLNINKLLVVSLSKDTNSDAFRRLNRSIQVYNLNSIVLDSSRLVDSNETDKQKSKRDQTTREGSRHREGQQNEVELVRRALSSYRKERDLAILVINGDRLILNGNQQDIIRKFQGKFRSKTRIVLAGDSICSQKDECFVKTNSRSSIADGRLSVSSSVSILGMASSLWQLFNTNTTTVNINRNRKSIDDDKSLNSNSNNIDNLQYFCSQIYLDKEKRDKFGLELDEGSELFQSIRDHDEENTIELEFELNSVKVKNLRTLSEPLILFASGPSEIRLNTLGNYLAKAWTLSEGCNYCNESSIDINSLPETPLVLVGLFIVEPTPFLDDFFRRVTELDYPKDRIHLLIYNAIEYHKPMVEDFFNGDQASLYASKRLFAPVHRSSLTTNKANVGNAGEDFEGEWQARDLALEYCKQLSCDYYLSLDSISRLELDQSLRILIEANKTIVGPILSRSKKLWSNFWGSMTSDGFYARSFDYVDLIKRDRRGIWNVPQIMNAYLINGKFIRRNLDNLSELSLRNQAQSISRLSTSSEKEIFDYHENVNTRDQQYYSLDRDSQTNARLLRPALAFSQQLRTMRIFQYAMNTHQFGYLIDPTNYDLNKTKPDFYQLEENPIDWERVYLHENYSRLFDEDRQEHEEDDKFNGAKLIEKLKENESMPYNNNNNNNSFIEEPCQDVYWFPLVSDKFSTDLITIMEKFGRWSNGNNDDPRIEGGYESVPTRDIHLKQVGLHEMWLTFLRDYVMPVQLKQYIGYEHDPPRADLAFVVRYNPAEQPSLRPHHDSSTYTLNIALNSPKLDYEGGGCRFVRYNCSVVQTRPGWALIHPGRLTHYHEGLPVTRGTRYILVTFVDP